MAQRAYSHTLSLSIGGDTPTWEGEATATYIVTFGAPERGPTYASGGQPADPDEIEDIIVTHIDGELVDSREHGPLEAQTLEAHIEGNDRLTDALLVNAVEQAAADAEDAREYRAEQRREWAQ